MIDLILKEFQESQELLSAFLNKEENLRQIDIAAKEMIGTLKQGKKIISCGNGGSMSDAMHFAEELTGRYRENRKPYAAISISDPSYLTCTANDYGFEFVFSRFVEGMGQTGDTLLAISTSGNSENVINAAKISKEKGLKVIALTGKDGGRLKEFADICIIVPHQGYADRIQEIHIKIIHIFILLIEKNVNL